ncbi:MAG: D-alanine--D-alanine ligase family protein, partial [Bacillota bacterium]
MALTVGLLYNLGKGEPPEDGDPPDAHAELDGEHTVAAVAEALRWAGHHVVPIEASSSVWEKLQAQPLDIAFNMTEGVGGGSRESQVPAILEMLGIPYTGSNVLTLAVSLDKPTSKKLFAYHGVPTPRFRVVPPGGRTDLRGLRFPLFVKPAHEGSSMGISPESVCRDRRSLDDQVAHVHRYYRQEALVEEFLEGREFTVGLVGNEEPLVFPIMEINFDLCPPE